MSCHYYRITRFNYWYDPWINPHFDGLPKIYTDKSKIAHHCLSKMYEGEFERGDEDAIFEFVRSDARALEAAWVGRQITKWRTSGSREDMKKLKKLFSAYTDDRGDLEDLKSTIRRDQQIYRRIKELRKQGKPLRTSKSGDSIFGIVAGEFDIGEGDIKDAYDAYRRKEQSLRKEGLIDSDDDFFEWLEECCTRL